MTDVKRALILMTTIGLLAFGLGALLAFPLGTGTHAEPARGLLTIGLVLGVIGGIALLGIYTFPKDERKDPR